MKNSGKDKIIQQLYYESLKNKIMEKCANQASFGYSPELDELIIDVKTKIYLNVLDECLKNPTFDSEIYLDSITDDIRNSFSDYVGDFKNFQEQLINK